MGSPYEKKYIELTEEDRAKVTGVYHAWQQEGYEETYQNVPEFCYSASFEEVAEKGFTLVPSRYIEFVNRDEAIDFDTKMKTLKTELKELLVEEEKSKADLLAVFKELGYEIELIKEREHLEKISDIKGEQKEITWGSQIRSYVFMPYTLVKDHRTGCEKGNISAVMDGDLDDFITAYLKALSQGTLGENIE